MKVLMEELLVLPWKANERNVIPRTSHEASWKHYGSTMYVSAEVLMDCASMEILLKWKFHGSTQEVR